MDRYLPSFFILNMIPRMENVSAYNSEDEEMLEAVDEMYEEDSEFVESEKHPNQLLLGTVVFLPTDPYIQQLGMSISPDMFLTYPYQQVKKYISVYSAQYRMYTKAVLSFISNKEVRNKMSVTRQPTYEQVEILSIVNEPNGAMVTDTVPMQIVVMKTFWLRILQRTWKRRYKALLERVGKMKDPSNLRDRELIGTLRCHK